MPKMNPQGFAIDFIIANISCSLSLIDSILFVGIYVNKNLRLDNIQVYGFDYDYTLAHYSSDLQSLIYDLAKQHMVNEVILYNLFLSRLE